MKRSVEKGSNARRWLCHWCRMRLRLPHQKASASFDRNASAEFEAGPAPAFRMMIILVKSNLRGAALEISPSFVDENFPTCHTFQFQNGALEPRVVFQFFSHFIFIFRVDDQERATREARFIEQGAAHHDEAFPNEFIDEGRVFVPEGLLPRALRWIAIGAS